MKTKLYLVTRADLPPGQQAVQAAHAMREFVACCPEVDLEWYRTSNTLAFLAVPDEDRLSALLEKARSRGCPAASFQEPDLDHELTAIALGPEGKRFCRCLPLALR